LAISYHTAWKVRKFSDGKAVGRGQREEKEKRLFFELIQA
jgi:hypothetical protein